MPFFQGATDFDINGGNFHDVQGNQNNNHDNHSINFSGRGNTTTFAPNHSTQDNRTFGVGFNSMNMQAAYGLGTLGTQNYAGGAVPQDPPMTPHQHYQAYVRLSQLANSHLQAVLQAAPPLQGSNNPNLPQVANNPNLPQIANSPNVLQIANQPYDQSGDTANIIGQANRPHNLNSRAQLQRPAPQTYEQQRQTLHNPQPLYQLPPHLSQPAALAGGAQLPGLPGGQGAGPSGFGASAAQQSRPYQHQHLRASTSPPQSLPLNSTHSPNRTAQAPLPQRSPLPSPAARPAPVVPSTPSPSSSASQGPSSASSTMTSDDPQDSVYSDKEDSVEPVLAPLAVLTMSDTSNTLASAVEPPTDSTSGPSPVSIIVASPPASPSRETPPSPVHRNPTGQLTPAPTPLSHTPAGSPVTPNAPLTSHSLVEVTASSPAPVPGPASNSVPGTPQAESSVDEKKRLSWFSKMSVGKKKQKVGQAAVRR